MKKISMCLEKFSWYVLLLSHLAFLSKNLSLFSLLFFFENLHTKLRLFVWKVYFFSNRTTAGAKTRISFRQFGSKFKIVDPLRNNMFMIIECHATWENFFSKPPELKYPATCLLSLRDITMFVNILFLFIIYLFVRLYASSFLQIYA